MRGWVERGKRLRERRRADVASERIERCEPRGWHRQAEEGGWWDERGGALSLSLFECASNPAISFNHPK